MRAPALPLRSSAERSGAGSSDSDVAAVRRELSELQAEHTRLQADYRALTTEVLPQKMQLLEDAQEKSAQWQAAAVAAFELQHSDGGGGGGGGGGSGSGSGSGGGKQPSTSAAWSSLGSMWRGGDAPDAVAMQVAAERDSATLASLKATCQTMAAAMASYQESEAAAAGKIAALKVGAAGLEAEVAARDETIDALHRRLEEKAGEVSTQMDEERRLGLATKHQADQLSALEDSGDALREHLAAEAAATAAAEAGIKFLAATHPEQVGWAGNRAELDRRMQEVSDHGPCSRCGLSFNMLALTTSDCDSGWLAPSRAGRRRARGGGGRWRGRQDGSGGRSGADPRLNDPAWRVWLNGPAWRVWLRIETQAGSQ